MESVLSCFRGITLASADGPCQTITHKGRYSFSAVFVSGFWDEMPHKAVYSPLWSAHSFLLEIKQHFWCTNKRKFKLGRLPVTSSGEGAHSLDLRSFMAGSHVSISQRKALPENPNNKLYGWSISEGSPDAQSAHWWSHNRPTEPLEGEILIIVPPFFELHTLNHWRKRNKFKYGERENLLKVLQHKFQLITPIPSARAEGIPDQHEMRPQKSTTNPRARTRNEFIGIYKNKRRKNTKTIP